MQVNDEDRLAPQDKSSGTNGVAIIAIILVLLLSGGAYFYFSKDSAPESEITVEEITLPEQAPPEPLPVAEPVPEPEPEPMTHTQPEPQVPTAPATKPLPSLDNSDTFIEDNTLKLADGMDISKLLVTQNMARRFVVFVDNLAQGELARKTSPLKGPSQIFTVTDITDKTYLNPDSYHRYDVYADFLSGLDEQQLVATYKKLLPLLNQAFDELGYQNTNFSERVTQAIDQMLAAPVIEDPIELNTISVNYRFVDPELEALPAAQKLMIRMGPENSRKVKAVLKKLKTQLTAQ
ncbi:MAG: DUF3014 domain-containing protein [Shewanella sp.]|nr:DUF3014 domain-containing protein [Shewanella sp.]MCF1430907.1 DUF3014 domain-containing protein [Shewanella sp.]MCF1438234.1 DUF3014 domain-containing protein [Shewanella sp.]MCF1457571.1 DUF3014 domain-containing protein [Shewanella sp.]